MSADIIEIDIGVVGAIATMNRDGQLVSVVDMPVLNDSPAGRRAVNAPLLAEIIFKSHAAGAFVEFVGVRPGEGAAVRFRAIAGRRRGRAARPPPASPSPGSRRHPGSVWLAFPQEKRARRTRRAPRRSVDGRLTRACSRGRRTTGVRKPR